MPSKKGFIVIDIPKNCKECIMCYEAKRIMDVEYKSHLFFKCMRQPEGLEDEYLNTSEKPKWCPIQPFTKSSVDKLLGNENEPNKELIKRIIDYFNSKCNTHYRYNTKGTREHINARLMEGYKEEDFYTVIDKKSKEWRGTKYEEFLRPITLFSTKFESYLNQRVTEEKNVNIYDEWRDA